jgi:hypothetical protein
MELGYLLPQGIDLRQELGILGMLHPATETVGQSPANGTNGE